MVANRCRRRGNTLRSGRAIEGFELSTMQVLSRLRSVKRSDFTLALTSMLILASLLGTTLIGGLSLPSSQSGPIGASVESIASTDISIQASPAVAIVGVETTFFINITSTVPNATITLTTYFDATIPPFDNNTASPWNRTVTGNPAAVTLKWTYNQTGNLTELATGRHYVWVRVWAQDNESSTVSQRVRYFFNSPPEITTLMTPQIQTSLGKMENFSIGVKDLDNDTLTVTWDFGDGTTDMDTLTSTLVQAFSNRSHAWTPTIPPLIGNYSLYYWLNVSIRDPVGHWANSSTNVTIYIPPNFGPSATMTSSVGETDPADPVTFYASARDPQGEGIYWYFDFGDGTKFDDYTSPTAPNTIVWNNQTHLYASSGANRTYYNATLNVTDGGVDHNYSTGNVTVVVVVNGPPSVGDLEILPQTLELNVTIGYLNVTFSIQVNDPDGDNLTAVWNLDDGSPLRTNESVGAGQHTFRQWRNFTEPCYFNVTVNITDGREGHWVLRYLDTVLLSTNNPPMIELTPTFNYTAGNDAARPGETINITMKVSDKELDNLTIVWNFGDGSVLLVFHYNESDYVNGIITCNVSHAFSKNGTYRIRVWITDNQLGYGKHNATIDAIVTVKEKYIEKITAWDWWDYTSLGLFMMVPLSVLIYSLFVFRRRRRLDDEGINWDEYRTKKQSGLEEEL